MEIKTETRTVSIALRLWRGGWNVGYEPDCFADLENGSFAREFGKGLDEETGAILATDADLDNLIDWWRVSVMPQTAARTVKFSWLSPTKSGNAATSGT